MTDLITLPANAVGNDQSVFKSSDIKAVTKVKTATINCYLINHYNKKQFFSLSVVNVARF